MSRFPATTEQDRRQDEAELALLALFLWESQRLRYVTRAGRIVPKRLVRRAVDAVVATVRADVRALARAVSAGEMTVAEWQDATARLLKAMHVAVGAAGAGGFRNMTPGDIAEVEATLRFTFTRLESFARDISQGTTRVERVAFDDAGNPNVAVVVKRMTEERIIARASMYAEAGGAGYENIRRSGAFEAGLTEEKRQLHPADHCRTCVEEAAQGWRAIGTLRSIGDSECLTNCACEFLFR